MGPLAVSLSNLAGAVALAILMWRRIGGVEAASTLTALTRIIVASVVASALAVGIWWAIDAAVGRSTIGQSSAETLAVPGLQKRRDLHFWSSPGSGYTSLVCYQFGDCCGH